MIAIHFEEDQHSRGILANMLARFGYNPVLWVNGFDEFDYYVTEHRERIRLILASQTSPGGLDLPLSHMIIHNHALDFAPFIVMTTFWLPSSLQRIRTRHSRIDACLPKPFGERQLKQSISLAHQNRARSRTTLVVLSRSSSTQVASAIFAMGNRTHWRTVVPTASENDLDKVIEQLGFRIGGILVDPELCLDPILARLGRFKKTHLGTATPVGVLSRNAEKIRAIRPYCDLYFDIPDGSGSNWEMIIELMSKRLLFGWDARIISFEARQAIKENRLRVAEKLTARGLNLDANRWEFMELAGTLAAARGRTNEAVEWFKGTLNTNPCSPLPYLRLLELSKGIQKQEIARQASQYCAAHPQVRALATETESETV